MMQDKLILPKNNLPETYTVSYFNEEEWNMDLTSEQIEQQQSFADYQAQNEAEGYGPCNWNNPRCSCQYRERWVNLRIPCLVESCRNKSFVEWFHSKDGHRVATDKYYGSCGVLERSNKARIQCRGCGDVGDVDDWKVVCSSDHGGIDDLLLEVVFGGGCVVQ